MPGGETLYRGKPNAPGQARRFIWPFRDGEVMFVGPARAPLIVRLMRGLSSHLSGHRPVEGNSHKTYEFSARKSGVEKRMRIRDEPSGGSRQTVVFWEAEVRLA